MAKVTKREQKQRETIQAKTVQSRPAMGEIADWWNANDKKELAQKLISTVDYLKQQNNFRYRQAATYSRLYGNLPLQGVAGTSMSRLGATNLPSDRPTMSVITSCTDTIVSRLSQSHPLPVFLTDNADYKQRNLAKQMNQFIAGEFYQTKAYANMALQLRDACVIGTGVIKTLRNADKRVVLERRLATECLVDANDAYYGDPRMFYEIKLIDRQMVMAMFEKSSEMVEKTERGYPEMSGDSQKSIADQIIVAEAWRLPSSKTAGDGLHVIACSQGVLQDREWTRSKFPFTFLQYSPRMVGLWGQSLVERQMGTQTAINQLLMTTHRSINLVGVPRVFVEKGSKVVKAHLNNDVGAIVEYSGTKPIYEVAPCVPQEIYAQLERLIKFAYNQEGVSELAAVGQKPAGINSGQAQREYDNIQSDRFAALNRRYDDVAIDLAHQIIAEAIDIAKEEGEYKTIFPDKTGAKTVKLADVKALEEDPYVIQCFDMSSLPRDPAGRSQKIIEYMQSGLYSPQEGRRLLGFSDTAQVDKLEIAAEERILQILDKIVEDGDYSPPDPFMDLQLALKLVTQYYNLYVPAKLEESRAALLRNFFTQVQDLIQKGTPPPSPGLPMQPQAQPMAPPQSDMIQNVPGPAA